MTRAMFDAQQDMNTNFTFGNVTGAAIENLAAKPTIAVEAEFLRNPVTKNVNGRIIYKTEEEGASIDLGEFRHKAYFIDGYIQYTNISKFNDATIMSIKQEFQRVMNVNNNSVSRTYRRSLENSDYDGNPVDGEITFTLRIVETDVSAIA
ncbi:hypothetical protein LCGC14_1861840 [marine sediment metagenome]|uniref:Uncharacterized protein n=1 Tax=marine sediment metagenome TaxID=412755 RepID=A0A0F9G787_9ZZZZ